MKSSSVSARIDSENARRLDELDINISDLINKAINEVVWNQEIIEEKIKEYEIKLDNLKNILNKVKNNKKVRDIELRKFFKESKKILNKKPDSIIGRIRLLNNLYDIPTSKYEFYKMLEEYTK